MATVVAQVAPRIILPSFFIGQKVITMNDREEIAQTIAFSALFVCATFAFFSTPYWIGIIPAVAAWSYWNMLRDKQNKQTYRYVDWSITTPLMLLAILVSLKAPIESIIGIILCDILMIGTGYLGVTTEDKQKKFGYFFVGMLAFLPIIYTLLTQQTNKAAIYLTLGTWILYPIVWSLEEFKAVEEKNITVIYSVMDMIAKIGLVNLLHI